MIHSLPQPDLQRGSRSSRPSQGFTLVEVLVVIGVIALLMTILVIAIGPTIENARVAATRTTITQLNHAVQQKLDALNRLELQNKVKQLQFAYNSVPQNPSLPASLPLNVAESIARRDQYRALFPQCLRDLYGLDGNPATPVGNSPLTGSELFLKWVNQPLPNVESAADSSELLYLALTQGVSLGGESFDVDTINPKHIGDSDKDGRLEFLDAWGQPLRFYNAPTRLFRPDGVNLYRNASPELKSVAETLFTSIPGAADATAASPLVKDPFDPVGRLDQTAPPFRQLQVSSFGLNGPGHTGPSLSIGPDQFYDPQTYFAFLIVSAGPDETLGLGEPHVVGPTRLAAPITGQFDRVMDNITNRQQ